MRLARFEMTEFFEKLIKYESVERRNEILVYVLNLIMDGDERSTLKSKMISSIDSDDVISFKLVTMHSAFESAWLDYETLQHVEANVKSNEMLETIVSHSDLTNYPASFFRYAFEQLKDKYENSAATMFIALRGKRFEDSLDSPEIVKALELLDFDTFLDLVFQTNQSIEYLMTEQQEKIAAAIEESLSLSMSLQVWDEDTLDRNFEFKLKTAADLGNTTLLSLLMSHPRFNRVDINGFISEIALKSKAPVFRFIMETLPVESYVDKKECYSKAYEELDFDFFLNMLERYEENAKDFEIIDEFYDLLNTTLKFQLLSRLNVYAPDVLQFAIDENDSDLLNEAIRNGLNVTKVHLDLVNTDVKLNLTVDEQIFKLVVSNYEDKSDFDDDVNLRLVQLDMLDLLLKVKESSKLKGLNFYIRLVNIAKSKGMHKEAKKVETFIPNPRPLISARKDKFPEEPLYQRIDDDPVNSGSVLGISIWSALLIILVFNL